MGAKKYFEAIDPTTKNNFFHHCMIEFVNRLKFNDHKYKINGTKIDKNYKGKLLFTMQDFLLFGTDSQINVLYVKQIIKR